MALSKESSRLFTFIPSVLFFTFMMLTEVFRKKVYKDYLVGLVTYMV